MTIINAREEILEKLEEDQYDRQIISDLPGYPDVGWSNVDVAGFIKSTEGIPENRLIVDPVKRIAYLKSRWWGRIWLKICNRLDHV